MSGAPTRVFIARLAGVAVFDPHGDQVGRVRDVVVALRIDRKPPRVLGLVVEVQPRRRIFVPMTRVTAVDVGQVGLRSGALTSAADKIVVRLEGTGGHTSRPHLTGDLTFALAKVITELPAVLSRRLDPRTAFALVWGEVHAGQAANVIP